MDNGIFEEYKRELENYVVENGIIRSCGKFEGEKITTLYFYTLYMNGEGYYIADDVILFGDLSYYRMNIPKSPEISTSEHAGFVSGKTVYRGLAVADGKVSLTEAFVKLTKTA